MQNTGGKTAGATSSEKFGEIIRRQLDVAVQHRNPLAAALANAAVHGRGETGVAAHRNHTRSTRPGQLGRAVGRTVVHHQQLRGGLGLDLQAGEQPLEKLAAVPHRHNGGNAHGKRRFFSRKARL